MRRWAQKVGADPYTTNPALKKALEDVARVDVSGSLATKIVVPIPPVVGTTAQVGDLVWAHDPEALRKTNEREPASSASARPGQGVLRQPDLHPHPADAAHRRPARGACPRAGDYVAAAAEAEERAPGAVLRGERRDAAGVPRQSKVASVLTDSRALVAKLPSGQAVALLPLDWVRVSGAAKKAVLTEMGARAKAELGATSLALSVSGQVTERATREFAALGWTRAGT